MNRTMKLNFIIIFFLIITGYAVWAEENHDLIFLGTIEKLYISPLENSRVNWVVQCRIDKIITGKSEGKSFSFRIHSPSQSGLEIGKQYKVEAKWAGDSYTVDEYQWAERAINNSLKQTGTSRALRR